MEEIVLHPKVKQALNTQIQRPGQGILLTGEAGAGKGTVARWLAAKLLNISFNDIQNSPFVMSLQKTGKTITVDSIRQINNFLKLKSINPNSIQRLIIIEDAQTMTTEAQNALLKNLEEPPAGTVFVMTATSDKDLLPTITSRLQVVKILPPNRDQLAEFFEIPDTEFIKAYNLSGGLPGLLKSIIDDSEHPIKTAIENARAFLTATAYERLKLANDFGGQKTEALVMVQALKMLANAAIFNASTRNDDKKIKRWQNILESALNTEEQLEKEANLKLALTNLALSL